MGSRNNSIWLKILEASLLALAFVLAFFLLAAGTQQYWNKPALSAVMRQDFPISPNGSITLKFNQQVKPEEILKTLEINPKIEISPRWLSANSELEIMAKSNFQPGEKYSVSLSLPEGLLRNKTKEHRYEFSITKFPQVVSVIPGKEAPDIKVDSEISVQFDSPIKNYNINFEISPQQQFEWESDSEKKNFRIFSKDKLQYETAYWMKITAQPISHGAEAEKKEIFYGKFQTEKKPVPVVVKSNSSVIPEDQVVDLSARIAEGKYIDINLAKQQLSIFQNGIRLGTYRISSGKRGMATPTGNFKIMGKRGRAWSKKYKLFMPYFMQFTGAGHGIHELPEWPGGYKEGAAHLGIPVSHGCVRLGVGPAEAVYAFADIGTPVVIHY